MIRSKVKVVVISEEDNVGIALATELIAGEEIFINGRRIIALDPIPVGHKISISDIPEGGWIKKFGEIIGQAKCDIKTGEHVHVHNVSDITELISEKSQERT